MPTNKVKLNLYLDADTAERIKQYAAENHRSASQAVTDWIWQQEVYGRREREQAVKAAAEAVEDAQAAVKQSSESLAKTMDRLGLSDETRAKITGDARHRKPDVGRN